ncbi:hypothetical protein ABBQ38_011746 [Trebouxia sp. C0009 RCD-2024]
MPQLSDTVPFFARPPPQQALEEGARLDGRGFEQFRTVFLNTGAISQATGSAYAEFSKTKVMAAVYGPRPSDRKTSFSEEGRLQCDVKFATFATRQRSKSFAQSPDEREVSGNVQAALQSAVQRHSFPKSNVDVYCMVLESGGSDVAVAITAASLALADAGIEMYDLVSACSVSRVKGQLLLDPTSEESYHEDGTVLMAMMPTASLVTQLVMAGEWSDSQSKEAMELCMGGCAQIDSVARQCLRQAAGAATSVN